MDKLDLHLLPQVAIDKPCPENWDAMVGDEQMRFCQGCGCHVHNLEELAPNVVEALLDSPDRTCIRMTTDPQRGVLTKSGWIPRLAIAGAMAASVSGCAEEFKPTPGYAMGSMVVIPQPGESDSLSRPPATSPKKVSKGKSSVAPAKVLTMLGETRSIPTSKDNKVKKQ